MSEYLDNLQKTTATNYSLQPGGSIHESFPAQASGGTEEYDDHTDKSQTRYGDNRSDLPAYKEDNEYSYARDRK